MALDEQKRKDMTFNCATRVLINLEQMTPYDKKVYMARLIDQLDDLHLIALNFAVEMTPIQKKEAE